MDGSAASMGGRASAAPVTSAGALPTPANDVVTRVGGSNGSSKTNASATRLDPMTARIVQTTQDLIRIPSQGGIDDPSAICDAVMSALAAAGLSGEILLREGKPVGVVAAVQGAHAGPTYVLNAVVDTAPIGEANAWSVEPFNAELRGNQLIGRGAGDSKAAAAIFIEVGRHLAERTGSMHGRALLFFDAAEHTGEFQGIRTFIEHCAVRPSGMLIGYPGNESLQIGSRGFLRRTWQMELPRAGDIEAAVDALRAPAAVPLPEGRSVDFPLTSKLSVTAVRSTHDAALSDPGMVFEVAIAGKAAHSGASAAAGINAVEKTASFLTSLKERGTTLFGDGFAPQILALDGGKEFSQVPDSVRVRFCIPSSQTTAERAEHVVRGALMQVEEELTAPRPSVIASKTPSHGEPLLRGVVVNVDMRTTIGFDIEDAADHLAACERLAEAAGLSSTHEDRQAWPAFRLPEGSPLQTAMMRAIHGVGLTKVQPRISGPSNAGNVAAAHGIPTTAGFGVSCKHAHGTNESINVASIAPALAAYTLAMRKLFEIPEGA